MDDIPPFLEGAYELHCKKYELYKTSAHLHPEYEQQKCQFYELVKTSSLYETDWEKYWLAFLKSEFIDTWKIVAEENTPPNQKEVHKINTPEVESVEEKVGALVNDPDFLDDLADVLKSDELGSIFENEEIFNSGDTSTSCDILSKEGTENCSLKTIRSNYFVESMKILSNLKCYFKGNEALIEDLYQKSVKSLEKGENPMAALSKDHVCTLKSICTKINLLSNNAEVQDTHRALLALARKELLHALDKPLVDSNIFLGMNIHTIAQATIDSKASHIVSFIENALRCHGFFQFSKSDIMRIFFGVRALQMKRFAD